VLAQAFTHPFTVYSAKRFPGVPGEMKGVHINFLFSHKNINRTTLNPHSSRYHRSFDRFR
jgi:hypothetical protein